MPRRPIAIVLSALAALVPTVAASRADDPPSKPDRPLRASDLVQVTLETDTGSITAGQQFHLAVALRIAEHWHVYWKDAGDSGAPTEIELKGPDGFTFGPTLFRARAFSEPDGTTYGYDDEVVLFVPVTAPKGLPPGDATFTADVFFLVCRDRCLIGNRTLTRRIPTGANAEPRDGARSLGAAALAAHHARLPRPLRELGPGATALVADGLLTVTGPAGGHDRIEFFPQETPGVTFGEPRIEIAEDRFRVKVAVEVKPQNALGAPMTVCGLVGLGGTRAGPCYDVLLPVDAP